MQIIPLNLDSVLLLLHNSKLAYYTLSHSTYLWIVQPPIEPLKSRAIEISLKTSRLCT